MCEKNICDNLQIHKSLSQQIAEMADEFRAKIRRVEADLIHKINNLQDDIRRAAQERN